MNPTPVTSSVALSGTTVEKAAAVLKAVSHPARLMILQLVEQHERLSVSELCTLLESEQSLVSHHLAQMRRSLILGCQRAGQHMYYYLRMRELSGLLRCMEHCLGQPEPVY